MSNDQTRSQASKASKRGTKSNDTDVAENPEITSLLFGRLPLLLPRPRAWLTKNVKNNNGILSKGDLLHLGQGDPQPLLRVLPVHGCWLSKSPEKPALSLQFLLQVCDVFATLQMLPMTSFYSSFFPARPSMCLLWAFKISLSRILWILGSKICWRKRGHHHHHHLLREIASCQLAL